MQANSPGSYHQPRIGIDLGGTKIEGLLLAPNGSSINRLRSNTPKGDYAATLAAICQLVDSLTAGHDIAFDLPVGIGTPGAVAFESGLIKNSNSTCLNGQDLATDLQAQLRRPVRIANDADCFALSEASDGAARGAHSVLGVILGTGVGGGLVYDGQLLRGVNGICGEWGHNTLPLNAFQPGPDDSLPAPVAGQRRVIVAGKTALKTGSPGRHLHRVIVTTPARPSAALSWAHWWPARNPLRLPCCTNTATCWH
jgi:hypothetical protein